MNEFLFFFHPFFYSSFIFSLHLIFKHTILSSANLLLLISSSFVLMYFVLIPVYLDGFHFSEINSVFYFISLFDIIKISSDYISFLLFLFFFVFILLLYFQPLLPLLHNVNQGNFFQIIHHFFS